MTERTYHFVSHTHWDREWYMTFEQFRFRQVELIDDLMAIFREDSRFRHFLLDGQSVLLEDYLDIRPEKAPELGALIGEGKISVGPWYVLADEFLVSGESLVRNLQIGRKVARAFGGAMNAGYVPDAFGHIAQLPQILRGFAIDNAFLLRGFGGEKGQEGSEYTWRAPDGSDVLLIHFSRAGYDIGRALPVDRDRLETRWEKIENLLHPRGQTPHLLVMNGGDHHWPQKELPAILETLASLRPEATFLHGTLEAYADAVRTEDRAFPLVVGELRGGFRHAYGIQGVYSTRMILKQLNTRAQRLLERWAEPFGAIAACEGLWDPRPFLERAWKTLLYNHPHDSICGCSIDPVHREMVTRFHKALELADAIAEKSLKLLAFGDDEKSEWGRDLVLFVFNPSPFPRSELVPCAVDFLLGSVRIGQGSDVENTKEAEDVTGFAVLDPAGREVPFQVLGEEKAFGRSDTRYSYPDQKRVRRFQFLLAADGVPALGFKGYRIAEKPAMPVFPPGVTVSGRTLENEFLAVEVLDDGAVRVRDKECGALYEGLNVFEDGGDVGDEYNWAYPEKDEIILSTAFPPEIRVCEAGPLRGALEVSAWLSLPARATRDEKGRAEDRIILLITSRIRLEAGARRVDFETQVENTAEDHRLRVRFPLGEPTDESWADSAFHVVRRKHETVDPEGFDLEVPTKTHPMQGFVTVRGTNHAFTLIADGLPEYEVMLDEKGTVALTLLRCVGKLSGSNLITRPGGDAGWKNDTPDAQCPGPFRARYAFHPHRPGLVEEGALWQEADRANLAMKTLQRPASQVGSRPLERGTLACTPPSVCFSALKPAQEDRSLILRAWNPTGAEQP
ncbi:MAG: alpha-mannosidase, partial [Planctomycetota bacterium]